MGKGNNYGTPEQVIEFVKLQVLKMEDSSAEINLTELEELTQEELNIPEEIWEEQDYSFLVFNYLYEEGYLDD